MTSVSEAQRGSDHEVIPTTNSDAVVGPAPTGRHSMARMRAYVLGNGLALFGGLVATYFVLTLRHSATINIHTVDFQTYYSEARLLADGHGSRLYDIVAQGRMQLHLLPHPDPSFGVSLYLYVPYILLLLAPLSALPYGLAYLVWLLVDCLMLAGAMFVLERHSGLEGRAAIRFRFVAVSFLPVFMALGTGQVSIFLLLSYTLSLVALRAGNNRTAGALLALSILKPFYLAPVLIVLVMLKRWRAFASFVVSSFVLLAVALPFCGIRTYLDFISLLRRVNSWQNLDIHDSLRYHGLPLGPAMYDAKWNHSIAGFTELLPGGTSGRTLYVLSSVAVVVVLVLFTRFWQRVSGMANDVSSHRDIARSWSLRGLHLSPRASLSATGPQPDIDIPISLAMVAGLLVSPHTLAYDYILVLIPVSVAFRYRKHGPRGLGVLLAGTYIMFSVGYRLVFAKPVQLSVLASLALFVWLVILGIRVRKAKRSAASAMTERAAEDALRPSTGYAYGGGGPC